MSAPTGLCWKRIRPGWYETGHEIDGAYVIAAEERPGSWIVSRWTLVRGIGYESLQLLNIESAGTLAYAKELAEFDSSLGEIV